MSAAAVATRPPDEPFYETTVAHTHTCPKCGTHYPLDQYTKEEKARIAELESQVRILTDKATAAVDKLADYEDELRQFKSSQNGLSAASDSAPVPNGRSSDEDARPNSANAAAKTSRFSSLLGGRRASPAQPPPPLPTPPPLSSRRESDLQAALAREQELRQKAEGKLDQMSGEIEDLSVQLFQQANEMVAAERKARAKLEERVEVLERRDDEKRKRLERLEMAVKRIERVRGLLAT
ncbi:hypothetical protein K432DRAFT_293450 [Lepidopterella palustris CBS 459.81]|uniref:GDP/GTP exchange factor Sec2 N-terminal domain-containing protein n=1 Tax=Lepidopterella palustris CBS 459.81 TaxID=1314670 RepID=A0A8E2EEI3_9PEZI|nr:hypothetical protein K432DRAFT_293450 [Lepidopterella palustris CBS 459.81]